MAFWGISVHGVHGHKMAWSRKLLNIWHGIAPALTIGMGGNEGVARSLSSLERRMATECNQPAEQHNAQQRAHILCTRLCSGTSMKRITRSYIFLFFSFFARIGRSDLTKKVEKVGPFELFSSISFHSNKTVN